MEAAFQADLWVADMADPESFAYRASYKAYNTLWGLGLESASYRTPIKAALASGSTIKAWFTDPDAFGEWLGSITESPDTLEAWLDDPLDVAVPVGFDWARLAAQVWTDVEQDLATGPDYIQSQPVNEPEDPQ